MLYALYLFRWRAKMIKNKQPGPYDDQIGPIVIVVALFLAVLVNFILKLTH